ncbi:hypothetical protein B296_00012681, partial [Ensete ventricosum]
RQKYDYEKEKRHKHRSRSHSKDRFSKRTKSRSPSPSKSKRTSGFDMAPLGVPDAAIAGIGSFALMPAQAVTQQTIATFFSHVMSAIGGNAAGPGDAVVNVYINHEKKFAFVEMRSVEEASNAMALDGIIFETPAFSMKKLVLQSGSASHFPVVALGANTSAELPTKVVCLTEVAVAALASLGSLLNLVIPRPSPTGEAISGVGKVFLEYGNVADSARAKVALHGRRFGGNVVSATYYSEEKFSTGDYGPMVMA